MPTPSPKDQTLITHLIELRKCLFNIVICLVIGFGITVFFSKDIYHILAQPLLKVLPENSHFIATHPFEAWLTYLKTALFTGLFLSSPIIFWQIWRFVSPGLYKKEKTFAFLFVILTSVFFVGGALFGYFYVFPYAFEYFAGILTETDIVFLPQMKDYLGFTFRLLLAFGIIFELPIIMVLLTSLGLVSVKRLVSFQKYMIVISFLISAILTPPDVITQILMGIPIIALYELGLLFSWMLSGKKQKT